MISDKFEMHYERRCLRTFPNTTKLGTRPYSKDGLIITRSVPEKMDNIFKNFEELVLCEAERVPS